MIPLVFADDNTEVIVRRVSGRPEVKKHLEDLGFVPGSSLEIISRMGDNLIVRIRESRIALDGALAGKIMV